MVRALREELREVSDPTIVVQGKLRWTCVWFIGKGPEGRWTGVQVGTGRGGHFWQEE